MRLTAGARSGVASVAVLASVLVVPVPAAASAAGSTEQLREYASATWASFEAMTDPVSGLPADRLEADGTRSVQTSTTNIGAYMWSALVAERLGIIGHAGTVQRLSTTIGTLEHMERYGASGQFYNWYDHRTGAKLTTWPPTGAPLTPILSSVDNGWLATGLRVVQRSVPELATRAGALFDSMNFGFYYRPAVNRILFFYAPDTGEAPAATTRRSARVASLTTSGSRRERSRRGPTSGAGAASRTAATGAGRRPGRPASTAPTSVSTSSKAPTPTTAPE